MLLVHRAAGFLRISRSAACETNLQASCCCPCWMVRCKLFLWCELVMASS